MNATELAKDLYALDAYDLSPLFETNMPGYVFDPSFNIIPFAKNVEQQYYNTQILVFSEHNGSHVDAPIYFHKNAASIEQYPADCLIAPYKKYDLRPFAPEAGKNIDLDAVRETEKRDNISPEAGDIVLLQYGWDRHYLPYTNVLFQKDWYAANAPGITEEVMRYFADRGIRAIGSDTVTPDIAYTESDWSRMPGMEKYFLPNGILTMGGFINMTAAPSSGLFMTVPLKIKNGSGSPIRPLLFDDRGRPEILRTLRELKAHDISPVFENNMPGFLNHPTLGVVPNARTHEKHGRYMQSLVMCEHNGSHTDSYSHIHNHMAGMDKIPCNFFIGPYKLYDFTAFDPQGGVNITLDQVLETEKRDGISAEAGDIALLRFGWDRHYKPESTDIEDLRRYSFGPGIDEDAVKYFSSKNIRAIGSDVVSTDTAFPHMPGHLEYFLPKGIIIMESFTNMAGAPGEGLFVAFPWKIKDGSGCPMRPVLFG